MGLFRVNLVFALRWPRPQGLVASSLLLGLYAHCIGVVSGDGYTGCDSIAVVTNVL
jgi:hypothetical protein